MEVKLEGNLALSKADQGDSNITLDWTDAFDLNPDEKEEAAICLIALVSLFIVLLLKHSPFIFSYCPTIFQYFRMGVEAVPESGMLMICGALIALTLKAINSAHGGLDSINDPTDGYLEILIAPIILHASYTLYHPHFFGQVGTILIMAFIATVLNVVIITPVVLFIYNKIDPKFDLFDSLTYASLISAVDPVAVLAVFDDVHANKRLYYLIFGESLLNDGVTFVLFESFKGLVYPIEVSPGEVTTESYLCILGSFVTAPLGGMLVGYIVGVFSAIISKWTEPNLTMIVSAVISYTLAKILGFSPIISLIVYGLTQERYTFDNMNIRQQIDANLIVNTLANIFETILFLLIGFEMVKLHPDFIKYWKFCLIVLLAITVARMVVTLALVFLLNLFRDNPISLKWQLIIFLGGLRGAMAYMMASTYDSDYKYSHMLKITTIFIIVTTTLVNGMLTKPLVVYFDLKQEKDEVELPEDYLEEYAILKKTCFFKAWYWWEGKVIMPLIAMSRKLRVKIREVHF